MGTFIALALCLLLGGTSAWLYVRARTLTTTLQKERASHQAELSEMEGLLQKTHTEDRSKNEFIATLAHELRNPLAPVLSTLELLKAEEGLGEHRTLIESAEDQAFMMRRLLDDLLDVARISQKKFKLQKETVELGTILAQCIGTVEPFMKARAQHFSYIPHEEELLLSGDAMRLVQIFNNLLYNAAKYTDMGGSIHVSVTRTDSHVAVSVVDTGVGIPEDMREYIFEPFAQIKEGAPRGSGLGLGLSLTKRLVEMHAGTIEVFSEGVGHGSTFTVVLPIPTHIQMPMPSSELPCIPEKRSALSILLIDDNEPAALGLEKLLVHKGHRTHVVFRGEEGITAAASHTPDVVLLDIGLPDMVGYEVARTLREQGYTGTLVALTGYGQDEDKIRAGQAGFDYHLVKPVGIADVERVLNKVHVLQPA